MHLRRAVELFDSHEGFQQFKKSFQGPAPMPIDSKLLRDRAWQLASRLDPRGDASELRNALKEMSVSYDPEAFPQISAMSAYLAKCMFRDISQQHREKLSQKIVEYEGPKFFFVAHASYFDYVLMAELVRNLGMSAPVTHFSGSVTRGWVSNWLEGFRALLIPAVFSNVQHRAYSWFTSAIAEHVQSQLLFARTNRYTVRSRDGILREPYVPHGVVSTVKNMGRAMVIPVAISYSSVPEDGCLTSPKFFPILSMFPSGWTFLTPLLFGLVKAENVFKYLEGLFGDVSIGLCEPFELENNNSLSLQRISHRAIEEIAKNKMIHPSHLVARAFQGHETLNTRLLREAAEREVDGIRFFFKNRYRKEPPFHPMIESDLPGAISQGARVLVKRRALSKSLVKRAYNSGNAPLLRFYTYYADRRIYPLSGRNTMTVVNAGAWGYTLALHIGMNLLKKPELSEHSLILYDSREDLIEKLTVEGRHPWHFKDISLPRSVRPEADFVAAVSDTSLILLVTPSKYFYSTLVKILDQAPEGSDLVIATKGFIPESGLLPCQTARHEMERIGKKMRISVLSGANLAHEIVNGGAGVTQIACDNFETYERVKPLIETALFRVVYSGDVIGTTVAAALKNVYAIGFGMLEGSKKAPENFLATYSTLVTAEIRHFGMLMGAAPETFDAESQVWMADLLATCRGGRSAKFGYDLAELDEKSGKNHAARILLEQYRKKRIAVEGFEASRFAKRMASQRGFHPPILGEIYSVLHSGKQIDVHGFMEKCLDALSHKSTSPMPSLIRSRALRY